MVSPGNEFAKQALKAGLRSFPVRFKHIPTARALEILVDMGHGSTTVWWQDYDDPKKTHPWTLKSLSRSDTVPTTFPRAGGLRGLEFFGGPPMNQRLYTGTLLAVLMDRLLVTLNFGGFKALDAIVPLREVYYPLRGW